MVITRLLGKTLALSLLLISVLGATVAGPQAVGATQNLGGMNLDGFCKAHGYANGVRLTGSTIFDWNCVTSSGATRQIANGTVSPFSGVCVWQYNLPNAYAVIDNAGNAYAMRCAAPDSLEFAPDNPTLQFLLSKTIGPYVSAFLSSNNLLPSEQQWLIDSISSQVSCRSADDLSPSEAWGCLQSAINTLSPIWNPPSAS